MRDNYYLDEELLDKVEVDNVEGKSKEELKKELRAKREIKGIKIALHVLMGGIAARLFYKTSNAKEKNTDYIDRF